MSSEDAPRGLWLTVGEQQPIKAFPGIELWTISTDTLMLALVRLAPGAIVTSHAHENEQTGGVVEGALRFTIGDETREVLPGQGYLIPANVTHSGVAGPDGALVIEVFAPPRENYRMPESR